MELLYSFILIGGLVAVIIVYIYIRSVWEYFREKKWNQEVKFIEKLRNYSIKSDEGNTRSKNFFNFFIHLWAFVSVIILILPYTALGAEKIGSLIEKESYETYYYGEISRVDNYDGETRVAVCLEVEDGVIEPKTVFFENDTYFDIREFDEFIRWDKRDGIIEFDECYVVANKGEAYYLQLFDEKIEEAEVKKIMHKVEDSYFIETGEPYVVPLSEDEMEDIFFEEHGYMDYKISFDYEFIEYESVGRDIKVELIAIPSKGEAYDVKNGGKIRLTDEKLTVFILVTEMDTIDDLGAEVFEMDVYDIFASDSLFFDVVVEENGGTKYPDAYGTVRVTINFDYIFEE